MFELTAAKGGYVYHWRVPPYGALVHELDHLEDRSNALDLSDLPPHRQGQCSGSAEG